MATPATRHTQYLLDKLEDPFTIFPLESVADALFKVVDEAETQVAARSSPWGMPRKYWSVEQEHYHEEVDLLIGAIFVLGQAAITQTVSILTQLRKHPDAQMVIPLDKMDKLIAHAAIEAKTSLSSIVIIHTAANYFKHFYEWPEKWDTDRSSGNQEKTVAIAIQMGMKPGEMTDNLLLAANLAGFDRFNPRAVAKTIQAWREAWARVLYLAFNLVDPNICQDNDDLA
jgi:hypothetical protein